MMKKKTPKPARTSVSRIVDASRKIVYLACLDANALATWRAPGDMKAQVHEFDAREGGTYRMSLTYTDPAHWQDGKTTPDTDSFHGRFVTLVPYEKIVEAVTFETSDAAFAGEMTMTTVLADAEGGTEVTVMCENLPPGIRPEDNELGCMLSLQNLARLVE
jgi:uncharacterized protein YndB with AHSA1/START domain